MSIICPTVTVESRKEYDHQINQALTFVKRIHIDISDGSLAPRVLLGIDKMWWPDNAIADIHIMSIHPSNEVEIACRIVPNLVILHAEIVESPDTYIDMLHANSIKVGIALLPETSVKSVERFLLKVDHVLIFSGNLGYQGGSTANMKLLSKVKQIKEVNNKLEIGWDGGVNDENVNLLADGGIDVINSGGFIQNSPNPKNAYAKLELAIKNTVD